MDVSKSAVFNDFRRKHNRISTNEKGSRLRMSKIIINITLVTLKIKFKKQDF